MVRNLLLVGAGGFVGAVCRYLIGGMVLHHTTAWKFPMATFVVNTSGCLVAGVLMALSTRHDAFSPELRLLLFTGLLGGFTTLSAFGVETVYLIQRHQALWAGLNVVGTITAAVGVLWLAVSVIR